MAPSRVACAAVMPRAPFLQRWLQQAMKAYARRHRRQRFLWRSFRSRHALCTVVDRTNSIQKNDILAFVCLRNEAQRLPHFLDHYRNLGIKHFLVVDNASTDGSLDLLRGQSDVSLWRTDASYRLSRFGLDWVTWLMMRHGHGHWCLTVDADELLIYPYWQTRKLSALTGWLEQQGMRSMAAMMLDLYPEVPLSQVEIEPGQDPLSVLTAFDGGNYTITRQSRFDNLWIQGGPRTREFFAQDPQRAPTLNKIPLVQWNRRYAYVNSTHSALPAGLNAAYATDGGELISGLLLHTKFLPQVIAKSAEEKLRGEHFHNSKLYDDYYDRVIADPCFFGQGSERLTTWRRLEALGLMSRGGWV